MASSDILSALVRRSLFEVGRGVNIARLRRKLTAAMMAKRIGVTRQTFRRVEQGDPKVASTRTRRSPTSFGNEAPTRPPTSKNFGDVLRPILINNVDDRLHNDGFLHVEGELRCLSPAFDVNPFPDRARELKTWISEETGPEASIDALLSTASYFGFSSDRAAAVLGDVERAVSTWRELATELGLTTVETEGFADAFEHEARATRRRMA